MEINHEFLVALSKSWGLFYLIAMAIGVLIYALRPANQKQFKRAKYAILDQDDRPKA
ncbi:cbb3-type cytochrome c oxidase subunit 3 [Paenochrobactrum sp. BZR 588]|uniref:cbb3-type cytochrome c oxidase subunit 3 n=1 Tax=Paenochrobactrum TaxID=999488 RepID=UPI0035BC7272